MLLLSVVGDSLLSIYLCYVVVGSSGCVNREWRNGRLSCPPLSHHILHVFPNLFDILLKSCACAQKTENLLTLEDGTKKWQNNCWKDREDYFECLHAKKEWAMVRRVNEEEKRQADILAAEK